MNVLENRNISLRAPEPGDLELLYLWENNTSIWRISGTLTPFSRNVLKMYLDNAGKDIYEMKQLRLIIQAKENHRPVGAIDLFDFDPHHHRAGVGILVADPSDRRKGYAREALETLMGYAFDILNLHQLYCHIEAGNEASIALFKKAGFTLSGRKKDWIFTGKGYADELLFQCVKGEVRG